jgi:UDP-N-acetylglucosamine--N-acetylmuramyl-(pentapeptide) pyrophosphoryl-undecaprenol N-acetylglucosamine transferase
MIAAGGTGGHVFPALAVANELKARDVSVVWVGTQRGMESQLVPQWGYPIKTLSVSALRGRGLVSRLQGVSRLFMSLFQSLKLMRREGPQAVLGMGGYVAGPVCVAARLCNKRTIMHEQNAVAGFTNRLIKNFASRVLEAVPGTFAAKVNAVHTGNPVRSDILEIDDPEVRMQGRAGPVRVLLVGGSQGAQALNRLLPEAVALLDHEVDVRHQAGRGNREETTRAYGDQTQVEVVEFIDDMAQAYAWADVLICRSGAMTVAEIAAVGVASVLVPYPYAVDDHQTANGQFLVDAGAAVMIQEANLSAQSLAQQLTALTADRQQLVTMALNARQVSRRNATQLVVNEILGEAA